MSPSLQRNRATMLSRWRGPSAAIFCSKHSRPTVVGKPTQIDTLIAACSLLASEDRNAEWALKATAWVNAQNSDSVLVRAWQAEFASRSVSEGDRKRAIEHKQWLLNAIRKDATYPAIVPPGAAAGAAPGPGEVVLTAMALAACRSLDDTGREIPMRYWQLVEPALLGSQNADGGWPVLFRHAKAPAQLSNQAATLSATAALFHIWDKLYADRKPTGQAPPRLREAIDRGLAWLGKNYDPTAIRPQHGELVTHPLFVLHLAGQLGRVSGLKRFGPHDWRAQGLRLLLEDRKHGPAWDWQAGRPAVVGLASQFLHDALAYPAFGRLLLERAEEPWPRCANNLKGWLSRYLCDLPMRWHTVTINTPADDWADLPILLISGPAKVNWNNEQKTWLRQYILAGGLLVADATDNHEPFVASIGELLLEMFPHARISPLGAEHPLAKAFTSLREARQLAHLRIVETDVRVLAVLSARDLAASWQAMARVTRQADFDLIANLWQYASGRGRYLVPPALDTTKRPARAITVGRVEWGPANVGNWDPEPNAWVRADILMRNADKFTVATRQVNLNRPVNAGELPVAHLTGTGPLKLNAAEKANLKAYVESGGLLIVDAAGGSQAFAESAEKLLAEILGPASTEPPAWLLAAADNLEKGRFQYRNRFDLPRVWRPLDCQSWAVGKGEAILFPYDLTAGLAGLRHMHIVGLDIPQAERVARVLLERAAR